MFAQRSAPVSFGSTVTNTSPVWFPTPDVEERVHHSWSLSAVQSRAVANSKRL